MTLTALILIHRLLNNKYPIFQGILYAKKKKKNKDPRHVRFWRLDDISERFGDGIVVGGM